MRATSSKRQRVRKTLLLLSFVAFPVTLNYFSPYLVVDASFRGVVNGSLIVFVAMFAGSLAFGRLWCGWLCPAAGLQEPLLQVNDRRVGRRAKVAKWVIWVPWVALIAFAAVSAGGYDRIDLLYGTVGGISVAADAERPIAAAYAIYFMVILLFLGLALALGRRGGCHSACWMAPFMIVGRGTRNTLAWPSLRLVSEPDACKSCGTCTSECPMSIDVRARVGSGSMEDSDCILCGSCVDACPQHAIRYTFSSGK